MTGQAAPFDSKRNIYTYAFEKSFPVMVGYLFLGAAYGILMQTQGYGMGWPLAMSVLVYAGSLQYASLPMLASKVSPLYAFLMALMINARHLFYGISMLKKYNGMGKRKPYLIFGLTDETFSVICNEKAPEHMDEGKLYFLITLLDQSYWVLGTLLGYGAGRFFPFDSTGLDFALTALFVVIFTGQWMEQTDHSAAIAGVSISCICLIVFGEDAFIIPAMLLILVFLVIGYVWEHREKREDNINVK